MRASRQKYIVGGGLLAASLIISGAVYAGYKHDHHHGYGHGDYMIDKAGKKGMRGMHRLDSNDDDQISLEEFTARAATLFNTLDANQDGTVSQDEFLAKPTERFTALDTDANGLIAGDEWPRKMKGHKRWGKKGYHLDDEAAPSPSTAS